MQTEIGSQQWLESRRNYIGASDAPVLMGVRKWKTNDGRFKTPALLWREKLGLEDMDCDNPATRFGKENESIAREDFEYQVGKKVPPIIVYHPVHSFIRATLDGMSEDGTLAVEIKCANAEDHDSALRGTCPHHYYAQLQHQLMCTGHSEMAYFSFHQGSGVIAYIKRNEAFIERLLKEEIAFWKNVTELTEPPLCEEDYVQQDDDWADCADRLFEIKESIKVLEQSEKLFEDKLKRLSDNQNSMAGGYVFTVSTRKGTVDYSQVPELEGVNVEKYRKQSTQSWRLKKWA